MYLNSMSEFKTIHRPLSFLPLSSCNPPLLHKRTQSSPCLMLANLPALSQLLLMSISPLSLDFTPKSVLSFRSPLEVIQRCFPPPISAMPSISSPLKGQKMLSRSPKPSPISSISLSPLASLVLTSKKLAWRLWSRPNALSSLPDIVKHIWTLPMHTRTGPWMTGSGWYGLMRPRSIA